MAKSAKPAKPAKAATLTAAVRRSIASKAAAAGAADATADRSLAALASALANAFAKGTSAVDMYRAVVGDPKAKTKGENGASTPAYRPYTRAMKYLRRDHGWPAPAPRAPRAGSGDGAASGDASAEASAPTTRFSRICAELAQCSKAELGRVENEVKRLKAAK